MEEDEKEKKMLMAVVEGDRVCGCLGNRAERGANLFGEGIHCFSPQWYCEAPTINFLSPNRCHLDSNLRVRRNILAAISCRLLPDRLRNLTFLPNAERSNFFESALAPLFLSIASYFPLLSYIETIAYPSDSLINLEPISPSTTIAMFAVQFSRCDRSNGNF